MRSSWSSATGTNGPTLNLMDQPLPISIGFIILLAVILTLISLLFDQPTILKRMKAKILKIFGSIIILIFINCSKPQDYCEEPHKYYYYDFDLKKAMVYSIQECYLY